MVPPASHKIPRASWYSGFRSLRSAFHLRGFHTVLLTFPGSSDRPLRLNAVLNPGEP